MKPKRNLLLSAAILAALALGLIVGRHLFPVSPSHAHADTEAEETAGQPQVWTCSMHPQIQQPDPGKCPICGMDLIPLESPSGAGLGPRELSMSAAARALAEIDVAEVVRRFPETEVRLVGKLDYDETRVKSLTARFPARIDQLFVSYEGVPVKKGEHLAEVYSPDLLAAQRELLTALRSGADGSIARAAREKLRLWDLLPEQIEEIVASGEAEDRFVLRAPIGGIVVVKNVKEGDYIKTGEPLFRIVDLTELWLTLDAYESDLPWLRYGQHVTFAVEAFPGETFHGRISFIDPEVDRKTRTISVRVNVPNLDLRLKPGMFARGVAEIRVAEDGHVFAPELAGKWICPMHPEILSDHLEDCPICGMDLVTAESLGYVEGSPKDAPLVVPSSAVLRTGKRAVVYIEKPNAEQPTFEGREIVLGPRAGDYFVVASGLEEGDRVVSNGAFKIDSALQIQAKPSMMSAKGETRTSSASEVAAANAALPGYLDLQSALASDDFDAAKSAVAAMRDSVTGASAISSALDRMATASDIADLRGKAFSDLSNAIASAATDSPQAFSGPLYLMHCPMAMDGRGADWIQKTDTLRNPYYGSSMLTCGEVKATLKEGQ